MNGQPLLTPSGWGIFAGFVAALIGLSIVSPSAAATVGGATLLILALKNAKAIGIPGA